MAVIKCLTLLATAFAAVAGAQTAVGIFEGSSDIGAPSHKGSVMYDAARKEYRITGGGHDIWGPSDGFFFVWKKITGDVAISATVKIVSEGIGHRKGVLMLRDDLEPGSPYADAALHGDGLTALQWREQPNQDTRTFHFPIEAPARLRIERRGNMVFLFAGKEGGPLTDLGGLEFKSLHPLYAGLGVSSHNDDAEVTAVFSDVTVEALPAAAAPKKKAAAAANKK